MSKKGKKKIKIDTPIVDCEIVKQQTMPEPYGRPDKVLGATYKIKPPTMHAALYITINHITLPDGSARPIEIFLNTKDVTHSQWMHALTRLLSAQFRSPLPFEFAIQELKEVVDPKGSYFIPGGGGQCGGIVDHTARIIEQHCMDIGAIIKEQPTEEQQQVLTDKKQSAESAGIKAMQCPKCHDQSLIMQDGCNTCTSCGYSKCG